LIQAQGHLLFPATAIFTKPGLEAFEFVVVPEIGAPAHQIIELGTLDFDVAGG
jgi:hypothetical protein